jgi:hypothetical protein
VVPTVDFTLFIVVALDFGLGSMVVLEDLVVARLAFAFVTTFFLGDGLDFLDVGLGDFLEVVDDGDFGDLGDAGSLGEVLEVLDVVLDEPFFGVPLEIFFRGDFDVVGAGVGLEGSASRGAGSTSDASATGASAASPASTADAASGAFLRWHMFPMLAHEQQPLRRRACCKGA